MQTILRTALWLVFALAATFATAQSDYRIKPGDQITIEVLEDPTLNRSVVVLPDGQFSFPFAGSQRAAGRTVSEVQNAITSAIARNYANTPTVFVSVNPAPSEISTIEDAATIDIFLLGEVNNSGRIAMEPGSTFLQALSEAGGLTPFAADKRVQLRRGSQVFQINYRALSLGGQLTNEIVLRDGDVILVPERRLFE